MVFVIYKSWVFTISFYICHNIHFANILIVNKSFSLKITVFFQIFSEVVLSQYLSWFSTILLNICQDIHFKLIIKLFFFNFIFIGRIELVFFQSQQIPTFVYYPLSEEYRSSQNCVHGRRPPHNLLYLSNSYRQIIFNLRIFIYIKSLMSDKDMHVFALCTHINKKIKMVEHFWSN